MTAQCPPPQNSTKQTISSQESKLKEEPETCIYSSKVKLTVSEQAFNEKQRTSMSLGIIVTMLLVLVILIWICIKKYGGLESHARKLL